MQTINATEAARRLGISDKTIRKWIADGKLPAKRGANGHYAIQVHDLHVSATTEILEDAVLHTDDFCDLVTSYPIPDDECLEAAVKFIVQKLQNKVYALKEIGVVVWNENESNSAR